MRKYVLLVLALAQCAGAGAAALTLRMPTGTIKLGDEFNVSIEINGPERINAAEVDIEFPSDKLTLLGTNFTGAAFPIEAQNTSDLDSAEMARGVIQPVSGHSLFGVLTFQSIGISTAVIHLGSGCRILQAADTRDVLETKTDATAIMNNIATTPPLLVDITNKEKITIAINPKTSTGLPAKLDGPAVWTIVSGLSALSTSADGTTAQLISSDTPGNTIYFVKGDSDLGPGVREVSASIILRSVNAPDAGFGLSVSSGMPK